MILVIKEDTGTSADKPRKEIIASAPLELSEIVAGHGSVAYCIANGTVAVFDEVVGAWIDTDGNVVAEIDTGEDEVQA